MSSVQKKPVAVVAPEKLPPSSSTGGRKKKSKSGAAKRKRKQQRAAEEAAAAKATALAATNLFVDAASDASGSETEGATTPKHNSLNNKQRQSVQDLLTNPESVLLSKTGSSGGQSTSSNTDVASEDDKAVEKVKKVNSEEKKEVEKIEEESAKAVEGN
jgi:hypothetical protein